MDLDDYYDETFPYNLRWTQERSKKRKTLLSPAKQFRKSTRKLPKPKWVDATDGVVPSDAVVGGHDSSGEPVYIARAYHEESLIPGSLVASRGGTSVGCGRWEQLKNKYQVLINGPNKWVSATGPCIPPGAFIGGICDQGVTIYYIGRVHYKGNVIVGKVQAYHRSCYVAFAGEELIFNDYEILME